VNVLHHRPRQRQAVVSRRAAPDLVQHDEASRRRRVQITAVSVISTMNVERPRARLSDAPMRVKMRSISGSSASSAGT